MVGSELRWRDPTTTAVRPDLVVVTSPIGDDIAGLGERREPVLVEALIAELAIEAFDIAVLHGSARFDQQVLDAVMLRPGNEGTAGELWAVVGAHGVGITAKTGRLVQ